MASVSKGSSSLENILTPEQNELLQALIGEVLPEIGQAGPVFGGQIAPDPSQLQQQAFGNLGGGGLGGEAQSAISRLLGGTIDTEARDRLVAAQQSSSQAQLQDTFKLIEERANASGAGRSGSLNQALAQAAGATQMGLDRFQAGLTFQQEQEAANRQLGGLGAFQSFSGAQLGAGGVQRNIAGQQASEAFNKWLAGQPFANPTVAAFLPTALGTQAQTPVEKTKSVGVLSR